MHLDPADIAAFAERAEEAARLLRAVANDKRLLILCRLAEVGELNVGRLAEVVGLSQSALSQHLGKMRDEGLVAYRRDAQTLHYRIADPNVERLLALLKDIYCPPDAGS